MKANASVLLGIVLTALWLIALWKAALWCPPSLGGTGAPKKQARESTGSAAIFPRIFWGCQVLLLAAFALRTVDPDRILKSVWLWMGLSGGIGLILLAAWVVNAAGADPEVRKMSVRYNLARKTGFEDTLYWARPHGLFENPFHITSAVFALFLFLFLSWTLYDLRFLAVFSTCLLVSVGVFSRYSRFTITANEVVLRRWLDTFPTRRIPLAEIANVTTDTPAIYRSFGMQRLTIRSADTHIRLGLTDAERATQVIDNARNQARC